MSGNSSIRPLLVAPPILGHVRVARARVRRADRDELGPVVAGFEAAHGVPVEADGVPLLQLADLVLDLDPAAAADEE